MATDLKKFSEEKYSTKDDVSKSLNIFNIEVFWQQILDYRKQFAKSLVISNIDRSHFSLTLTNSITNRLINLERKTNSAYLKYVKMGELAKNRLKSSIYEDILSLYSRINNVDISSSFIQSLIDSSVSTIPNDCIIIDNYLRGLNYIFNLDSSNLSINNLNALYFLLLKSSYQEDELKSNQFRNTSLTTPHYYMKGYIYEEALVDRIQPMIDELIEFANDSKEFAFVRAICSLFYLDYINPYPDFRKEIACLGFKLVLSIAGYTEFANFIEIENLFLLKDEALEEIKKTVQKTQDITYFVDFVLDFLSNSLMDLNDVVISISQDKSLEKNIPMDIQTTSELLDASQLPPSNDDTNPISSGLNYYNQQKRNVDLYGEVNVALPIFPTGLNSNDVEKIVKDLLETYPNMKKNQAHFYASHCTIGRSYTISQFKNEEKTSYETARTSMDYLAEIGFYQKSQLKNKFVYRPIPRRKIND